MVEHRFPGFFPLEHSLHHALDQGQITANPNVNELTGNLGGTERRHLHDVLRLGKADESALWHRVDRNDRNLALSCLHQVGHHSG
ncbi:hypothetical protein D3C72_2394900 [compost metagenome]